MKTTSEKVNIVYNEQNPSTYLRDFKKLKTFSLNREKLLLNLKLPRKLFNNSELIDFGSGTGLNTIPYSFLGAKCTMVEYDKKSVNLSKSIFKKFSRNKYKIVRKDIFNFRNKKKYDIVISNGVAHHTKNPILNLKICVKALKKNGFFILGIGETNGFFQRNLQRYILYKISKNTEDIIKFSKFLFKNHLKRSSQFSGRKIEEIIYDTYLNPKIQTVSLNEILIFFKKNNIEPYSFYGDMKSINDLSSISIDQFKLKNNKTSHKIKSNLNCYLHDIENFSLSNNLKKIRNNFYLSEFRKLNSNLANLTSSINDLEFKIKKGTIADSKIDRLQRSIKNIKNFELIDKKHNIIFLNELKKLLTILKKKKIDLKYLRSYLLKCKVLLKGLNGTGMNYIVGYKK